MRSHPFPRFAAGMALVLASMLGLAAGVGARRRCCHRSWLAYRRDVRPAGRR